MTSKLIFGRYWNKVVVDFLIGGTMLTIVLIDAFRFQKLEMPASLLGIATGLILINGFEWWSHGIKE